MKSVQRINKGLATADLIYNSSICYHQRFDTSLGCYYSPRVCHDETIKDFLDVISS